MALQDEDVLLPMGCPHGQISHYLIIKGYHHYINQNKTIAWFY